MAQDAGQAGARWTEEGWRNALAALGDQRTPPSYRRDIEMDILCEYRALAARIALLTAAETENARLRLLAHDLTEKERGAREEQIKALARLGSIVALDEHLARARVCAEKAHRAIDATPAPADAGQEG